jgi:hypothetical protein
MQTEAVSSEKSQSLVPDKDPTLLGVSLPIIATVTAATQVKDAWLEALTAVLAAARANLNEKKAAVVKKTNGAAKPAEPGEITA